ncbi:MAG: hypothetical protein IJX28_01115 [Clostridia bacterium]|nr:hypothetical protein [Clostridia bacterium]
MRLGYQNFRKWGLFKNDGGRREDRRLLIIMSYTFLGMFIVGLLVPFLFFTIAAILLFILYLSPRLSRYGSGSFRRLEAGFVAAVRADRVPKFPLLRACGAVLMIGSPLFSFWLLSAYALFFVGYEMWLVIVIPVMVISEVTFHQLKVRWKEMDGNPWIFSAFLLLLYLVFLGIAALTWWIV